MLRIRLDLLAEALDAVVNLGQSPALFRRGQPDYCEKFIQTDGKARLAGKISHYPELQRGQVDDSIPPGYVLGVEVNREAAKTELCAGERLEHDTFGPID